MSPNANPSVPQPATVQWADPQRQSAFIRWLDGIAGPHGLVPASLRPASADASFRRYLRIECAPAVNGLVASRIIMDAPPAQEDCAPFVKVAGLMARAGLNVPRVLEWDQALGFLLLDDLGTQTMIDAIAPGDAASNQPLYMRAVDALIGWQLA